MATATCGGGGYGDPTKRDPRRVVAAANREWVSAARARAAYRVALKPADNGIDYVLDEAETARLRGDAEAEG